MNNMSYNNTKSNRINPLDPSTTKDVAERLIREEEKFRNEERKKEEFEFSKKEIKELRKNFEIAKARLSINPNIYYYLSQEQQNSQDIMELYLDSRIKNSKVSYIGQSEKANVPQKIDEAAFEKNKKVIEELKKLEYNDQKYKESYAHVLKKGPYDDEHAYNQQYVYMLEYQKAMGTTKAQQLAQAVLRENRESIIRIAYEHSRLNDRVRDILDAAKQMPEFKNEIEAGQEAYWKENQEKVLELQHQKNTGRQLTNTEEKALQEAKLHLDENEFGMKERIAMQQEIRKMALRIAEEREKKEKKQIKEFSDMTARKNSLVDRINALSDIGAIGRDVASLEIGRAESLPSVISSQYAYQILEKIEDIYHDHNNDPFAEYEGGAVMSNDKREEEIDSLLYSLANGDYEKGDVDRLYELTDLEGYERYKEERDNGDYRYSGYADREIEREYNPNEKD